MQIQRTIKQNIEKQNLPAQAVLIDLLDKDSNYLASICCQHNWEIVSHDSENDRENSLFLEELSNFENEVLHQYFEIDNETKEKFNKTGQIIITNKESRIVLWERPADG